MTTVAAKVLAASGIDFSGNGEFDDFGGGVLQSGWTSQEFTVVNQAANRMYVYDGTGFQLDSTQNPTDVNGVPFPRSMCSRSIRRRSALFDFTGQIDASAWYHAIVARNAGNQNAIEALTSEWSFSVHRGRRIRFLVAGDLNDGFKVSGGNDLFDGQGGFDRVNYEVWDGADQRRLAAGTVTKYTDSSKTHCRQH